jgi:hypothetical protein
MAIIIKLVALAGFAIMFVWTLITGREQVPLTDRTQIVAVSEEETAALGAQAFQEVLSRTRSCGPGRMRAGAVDRAADRGGGR